MRVGSLFSGIGGLDLAVEQHFNATTVWQVEWEKHPATILARHFGVPVYGDVTTLDWSTVEPVDILCGGFPCQPYSFAGKRQQHEDERYLWPVFFEAIVSLRPSIVVIENVPGLLSGQEMEEPNDRCLCGWPYRRRGLHRDSSESEIVCRSSGRGDDDEGPQRSEPTEIWLRREGQIDQAGDGEMGGSGELVGSRRSGRSIYQDDPAVPDIENRTGSHSSHRGGRSAIATKDAVWQVEVDRRGNGPLRGVETSDARTEPEGADDYEFAIDETDCPACGRPVVPFSIRSVFRSGICDVLRNLAEAGFNAEWGTVRASDVGAPHRRERLFVLANPPSVNGQWCRSKSQPEKRETGTNRLLPTPTVNNFHESGKCRNWGGDLTHALTCSDCSGNESLTPSEKI